MGDVRCLSFACSVTNFQPSHEFRRLSVLRSHELWPVSLEKKMAGNIHYVHFIEIHDAANAIVKACEDELNVFVPPARKRRPEPTIAGMGARIKNYKKCIEAAKKSKEKPRNIRLMS